MDILTVATDISFALVTLGVAFAFLRLIIGPTLPDRVVALDMMTVLIVSVCGVYALRSEDTAFVDVAIVLALVGFLATVALARFVERRRMGRIEKQENAGAEAAGEGAGTDG